MINARACLERGAIINTSAVVEHDTVVEAFAHVAPGAVLCGAVRIGRAALIGAGSVVLPQVRIGAKAILGAGSVAVADVPDNVTAVGTPARIHATRVEDA